MNETKKDETTPGPRLAWTDGTVRIVKDERGRLAIETKGRDALGGERWEGYGVLPFHAITDERSVPGRLAAALDQEIRTHREVADRYVELVNSLNVAASGLSAEGEGQRARCRKLAELLMRLEGFVPEPGVDVLESDSPRAVHFVDVAIQAWTFLLGDAPDLEDEEEPEPPAMTPDERAAVERRAGEGPI